MKLIIAGSRELYLNHIEPYDLFKQFNIDIDDIDEYVNGDCPTGIDKYCNDWFSSTLFPADWEKHGKAAGPIRNKQMADYADALLVIHNNSKGSLNMKKCMLDLGKPVYEVILNTYNIK